MYRISIRNLVQNKLVLAKNYNIPPSEVDCLFFYEYETYLEEINILEKKQQKENEKQEKDMADMTKGFNPRTLSSQMANMSKSMSPSMPKMPSFGSGNFSMPKVSIPKF